MSGKPDNIVVPKPSSRGDRAVESAMLRQEQEREREERRRSGGPDGDEGGRRR